MTPRTIIVAAVTLAALAITGCRQPDRSEVDPAAVAEPVAPSPPGRDHEPREVGRRFCAEVVAPWRTLTRAYPFAADGEDAELDTLTHLLNPVDGSMWAFVDEQLQAELRRDGRVISSRSGATLDPGVVEMLAEAAELSEVLFGDEAQPRLDFEVQILGAAGISGLGLTVGDQRIWHQGSPVIWRPLSWPAEAATLRAKGLGVDASMSEAGDWGLFRLIERASASIGPEGLLLKWDLRDQQGGLVTMILRPTTTRLRDHPAGQDILARLRPRQGWSVPNSLREGAVSCAD